MLLAILTFIPIINLACIAGEIYLLCASGTKGKNRFDEQPQPASSAHKIALFTCIFLLVIAIVGFGVLVGISPPKEKALYINTSNWKTCATKNFMIKFPGNYEVTKGHPAKGVTSVIRSYANYADKIKLDAGEFDYSKADNFYKKAINDSLTATPENTLKNVLGVKVNAQNIKVVLDKSLHKYGLVGRELRAIIEIDNNTAHLNSIIYIDKPHYKCYILKAYYWNQSEENDDYSENKAIIKQFLDSFELLAH
jgi:hypothetical protein